jgi:hypothetical protein
MILELLSEMQDFRPAIRNAGFRIWRRNVHMMVYALGSAQNELSLAIVCMAMYASHTSVCGLDVSKSAECPRRDLDDAVDCSLRFESTPGHFAYTFLGGHCASFYQTDMLSPLGRSSRAPAVHKQDRCSTRT